MTYKSTINSINLINRQLHLSILARMTEACKAVIAMAPHPCLLDIRNDSVRAPLHYAIIFRQAEIVRLLLIAGADVSYSLYIRFYLQFSSVSILIDFSNLIFR